MASSMSALTTIQTVIANPERENKDVVAQLNLALLKLKKSVKDEQTAEAVAHAQGPKALLTILELYNGTPAVCSSALAALLNVLCYANVLDRVLPIAGQDVFDGLYGVSARPPKGSADYLLSMKALGVLANYAPNGFQLLMSAAQHANQGRSHPFEPLVRYLCGHLDEQQAAITVLKVLLRRAMGETESVVKLLLEAGLVAHLKEAERKLGAATVANGEVTPEEEAVREALDEIRVACHLEEESSETESCAPTERILWSTENLRQQLEREQTMGLKHKALTIEALAELAGVEFDPEAMMGVLRAQVRKQHEEVVKQVTASQQEATAMAQEKEHRALELQLEELRRQMEERIAVVDARLSAESAAREGEVSKLTAEHEVLMECYTRTKAVLEQQAYLKKTQLLWVFYQVVQLKLNEILLAYKVVSSGVVEGADVKSKVETAVEMTVRLVGELVPLPGCRAATFLAVSGMAWLRKHKREKLSQSGSVIAVSVTAMEAITEECARTLALRYEEQLLQCELEGAQTLAECGVRRMLEAIRCGSVSALDNSSSTDQIVAELLGNILSVDKRQGTLPLSHKTIKLREGSMKWNEASIYKKPGVRTDEDEFYAGKGTRPEKYGYRHGTAAEAQAMQLQRQVERAKPSMKTYKTLPLMSQKDSSLAALARAQTLKGVAPRRLFETTPVTPEGTKAASSTSSPSTSFLVSSAEGPQWSSSVDSDVSPRCSPAQARSDLSASGGVCTSLPKFDGLRPLGLAASRGDERIREMETLLDEMQSNLALLTSQFALFDQLHLQLDSLHTPVAH